MQTKTFNIGLPKDLVVQIDKTAKKEYRNRSELIREAVRIYISDRQQWEDVFGYGEKQARKAGIKTEQDIDLLVSNFRHGENNRRSRH